MIEPTIPQGVPCACACGPFHPAPTPSVCTGWATDHRHYMGSTRAICVKVCGPCAYLIDAKRDSTALVGVVSIRASDLR